MYSFISLIIYSIQPVFASDLLHTFQPISIRDSEYQFHLHSLQKIPLRIHVNGTRGKSSVTRAVPEYTKIKGNPAQEMGKEQRYQATLRRIVKEWTYKRKGETQ